MLFNDADELLTAPAPAQRKPLLTPQQREQLGRPLIRATQIPALEVVVLQITPRPAERPRFSKFGGAYNSKSYSDYKKNLVAALEAKIFGGQIRVGPGYDYARLDIDFFFPVPKSWTKKRKMASYGTMVRVKPDKDNAEKAVMDALQEAGILEEDSQIAQGEPRKWYVLNEQDEPRIELWLHPFETLNNNYVPRPFAA